MEDADGHTHPRMWVALPSSRSVRDGHCLWPPTGSRGLLPTVRSRKPPGQTYNPAGLSPVALQVLGRMANGLHCLGLTARPGTTTDTPRLPLGAPSGRGTLFGGGGSRSRATQVKPHPPTQSGGTASPGSSQATGNGSCGSLRERSAHCQRPDCCPAMPCPHFGWEGVVLPELSVEVGRLLRKGFLARQAAW